MKRYFWVKFENQHPQLWCADNFEQFWSEIREAMLKLSLKLEWIIID